MHKANIALLSTSVITLLLSACGASSGSTMQPNPMPPPALAIAKIEVIGQPVKVFDHLVDQQEAANFPDAQISAWREADGTVNLMIPSTEAYRMRGPDLLNLTIDPHKVYSSQTSGGQIPESDYNFNHWFMGPYSSDGVHFYTLSHSEWYACLLNNDCEIIAPNGTDSQTNSWANTVNSFASSDGGASWALNVVGGHHVVANTSFHWTVSQAFMDKIYLQAMNHTGMFQPTRLVHEGGFWYSVGYYIHRDFGKINPSIGVYEAPVDQSGYVLMRTSDYTNPNSWEAWNGGANYLPITDQTFQTFAPQQNGVELDGAPAQLVYDKTAHVFVLIHTLFGGNNAVYYMMTPSLANPTWSDTTPIVGSAQTVSDPGGTLQDGSGGTYGPIMGFNDGNFPSLLDAKSDGYNFEFINGEPYLFFSTFPGPHGGDNTGRDIYRLRLSVTYQHSQ